MECPGGWGGRDTQPREDAEHNSTAGRRAPRFSRTLCQLYHSRGPWATPGPSGRSFPCPGSQT